MCIIYHYVYDIYSQSSTVGHRHLASRVAALSDLQQMRLASHCVTVYIVLHHIILHYAMAAREPPPVPRASSQYRRRYCQYKRVSGADIHRIMLHRLYYITSAAILR